MFSLCKVFVQKKMNTLSTIVFYYLLNHTATHSSSAFSNHANLTDQKQVNSIESEIRRCSTNTIILISLLLMKSRFLLKEKLIINWTQLDSNSAVN